MYGREANHKDYGEMLSIPEQCANKFVDTYKLYKQIHSLFRFVTLNPGGSLRANKSADSRKLLAWIFPADVSKTDLILEVKPVVSDVTVEINHDPSSETLSDGGEGLAKARLRRINGECIIKGVRTWRKQKRYSGAITTLLEYLG